MTLKIKAISVFITISFAIMIFTNRSNAGELHFITEELPPNNYTENGQIKGIAVDLLREIWRRSGKPPQPIQVLPWSQGYELILKKPGTVLFSMARLGTRENTFKWAGPVISVKFVLFAKKDKIKPESLRNLKQFRFGAIINEAGEFLLLEQGVPSQNIDRSTTNAKMVKKLTTGKIDMIAFSELATQELFDKKGLDPRQFEAVGTLSGSSLWYAFHKDVPNEVVESYQKALDAIKSDGTYDKITNKYLKKK